MDNTETRQVDEKELALLVAPTRCKHESIMIARQVALTATCWIQGLVSTQAAGLIKVVFREDLIKNHACMTAQDIADVYLGRHFYITIANFGIADARLSKRRNVGEVAIEP